MPLAEAFLLYKLVMAHAAHAAHVAAVKATLTKATAITAKNVAAQSYAAGATVGAAATAGLIVLGGGATAIGLYAVLQKYGADEAKNVWEEQPPLDKQTISHHCDMSERKWMSVQQSIIKDNKGSKESKEYVQAINGLRKIEGPWTYYF